MNDEGTILLPGAQTAVHALNDAIGLASPPTDSLMTGKLGLSLYYYSLFEANGHEADAEACLNLLEEVMNHEEGNGMLMGTSLANGTAGLGYLLSLYQQSGLAELDLQEDFTEADQLIFSEALKQIEQDGSLDYLHGAMGAIHYFTTRSQEPQIRQYLGTLCKAVSQKAIVTEQGSWLASFIIDKNERELINTSLSHGNAGFLLVLLEALEAGVDDAGLEELIRSGIRFLLSLRMEPGAEQYALFPFVVNSHRPQEQSFNNRLAWCYGDLNIILLLYKAAACFNDAEMKNIADELAVHTLTRTDEASTQVIDAHFCHGAAGLAQVYHKLFMLTGQQRFDESATFWVGETLRHLQQDWKRNHYLGKEGDLLNGLPGIALVLLSYISKKEMAWSRLLLL